MLHRGACLDILPTIAADSIDACVTDPPYHLTSISKPRPDIANYDNGKGNPYARRQAAMGGFMGKAWDGGDIAFRPETWAAVLRVLRPGGHLVAFGAPRNYHRMACAIEDAGFEVRDCLMWIFGTGFPKSHDVSKGIDKALGAQRDIEAQAKVAPFASTTWCRNCGKSRGSQPGNCRCDTKGSPITEAARQWDGWGTALKPAYEPIILARKPLIGTVAENVLEHGTGALNIDACRVETDTPRPLVISDKSTANGRGFMYDGGLASGSRSAGETSLGRWPANVLHDGSDEVLAGFPNLGRTAGSYTRTVHAEGEWLHAKAAGSHQAGFGDSGSAARFFYSAKASRAERAGSRHPTVKPLALMRWLCRLVTPAGGTILDPFAGSGTTLQAAREEGFDAVGIEREPEYQADIERRLSASLV